MTKKISVLLAFLALFFAEFALAQGGAVVTSLVGSANVQTGSATPRTLRMGDQVLQGDTVSTGANSSLVLKFDDGEVAALTQNSRMTVTAYQYDASSGKGNMLLSLVKGGMRAITGLLGRNQPERVAYRAATTTIGIRGTDVVMATDGTNTEIRVTEGSVTVTVNGQTMTLNAGDVVYVQGNAMTRTPPPGFPSMELGEVTLTGTEGIEVGTGSSAVLITNVPSGGGGGPNSPH